MFLIFCAKYILYLSSEMTKDKKFIFNWMKKSIWIGILKWFIYQIVEFGIKKFVLWFHDQTKSSVRLNDFIECIAVTVITGLTTVWGNLKDRLELVFFWCLRVETNDDTSKQEIFCTVLRLRNIWEHLNLCIRTVSVYTEPKRAIADSFHSPFTFHRIHFVNYINSSWLYKKIESQIDCLCKYSHTNWWIFFSKQNIVAQINKSKLAIRKMCRKWLMCLWTHQIELNRMTLKEFIVKS